MAMPRPDHMNYFVSVEKRRAEWVVMRHELTARNRVERQGEQLGPRYPNFPEAWKSYEEIRGISRRTGFGPK